MFQQSNKNDKLESVSKASPPPETITKRNTFPIYLLALNCIMLQVNIALHLMYEDVTGLL